MKIESLLSRDMLLLLQHNARQAFQRKLHKQQEQIWLFTFFAWALVFFGFVAAAGGLWVTWHHKEGFSLQNLGTYGSYLQGTVASLWALAGLMFIYVSFLEQRKQLLKQQSEIEEQKQVIKRQQERMERQIFESSFFQLLHAQHQLVSSLKLGQKYQGKEYFTQVFAGYGSEFLSWLTRKNGNSNPPPEQRCDTKLILEHWDAFYAQHEAELGHYFRNLYHVVKFVDSSEIEPKRRYTSLVRAQLSKYELVALFYNCLGSHGQGFKQLVERYGLLEHLDKRLLLHPQLAKEYEECAYR